MQYQHCFIMASRVNVVFQRRFLIVCCGLTTLGLVFQIVFLRKNSLRLIDPFDMSPNIRSQFSQPASLPPCTSPVDNLVFVKTHKTASTTLQHIIRLYGYYRNLSFLFNANDTVRGHFRSQKLTRENIGSFLPPINVTKGDFERYSEYDVFAGHMTYDRSAISRYVKKDARYVTILREPSEQFHSAYTFFINNGNDSDDVNERIQSLIQEAEFFSQFYRRQYAMSPWLDNGQIVDLGLDSEYVRERSLVAQKIESIEKEFDLVLIADYFDQSLLLLRKLMCWDLEDILYLKQNVRSERSQLSPLTRMRIRKWNMADVMLYEHFKAILFQKIKEYGPTFHVDLLKLRLKLTQLRDRCIDQDVVKKDVKNTVLHKVKSNSSDYCFLVSYDDNVFHRLWQRQDSPEL